MLRLFCYAEIWFAESRFLQERFPLRDQRPTFRAHDLLPADAIVPNALPQHQVIYSRQVAGWNPRASRSSRVTPEDLPVKRRNSERLRDLTLEKVSLCLSCNTLDDMTQLV